MTPVGRFAPSPTGPLHAGSLVAALASWLDVRARGPGALWLVRIEDADTTRCLPGTDRHILAQLASFGLQPDRPPVRQTGRSASYARALDQLRDAGWAYPCGCSRQDIARALAHEGAAPAPGGERVYPGTCRTGLHGKAPRAWRLHAAAVEKAAGSPAIAWSDRRLGPQQQHVSQAVGDFVLRRADGPWAYQLAVVVDDAEQGVTDVVRGEDLADNTARQILLQQALGLPRPSYLHTPLVRAADGQKLSKQTGARALDTGSAAAILRQLGDAAQRLGLPPAGPASVPDALAGWVAAWRALYNPRP